MILIADKCETFLFSKGTMYMDMLKKFINKSRAGVVFTLSFSGLIVFMMATSPSDTSFIISFVPLLLIWTSVFSLILLTRFVFKGISKPLLNTLAATVASIVMLLTMFSALGQLAFFDVALILSLAALGVFYFRRSWPN